MLQTRHSLTAHKMKEALNKLDELISGKDPDIRVRLIVGGGSAMILAHQFPLSTSDIDAVPKGMEIQDLDVLVKEVARLLTLPQDWLNPYFSTFMYTLPPDYGTRLIEVFSGKALSALALGLEEMLIMKCFAHRQKDVGHAKALIRKGAKIKSVEKWLLSLKARNIPGSDQAIDFLGDLQDQME